MTSISTRTLLPTAALAAALLLAAPGCGAPGSVDQAGDPDVRGAGQTPERGQGTAVRDTSPHRPGVESVHDIPPQEP